MSNESLFGCQVKPSSSIIWRSILRCRDVLLLGIRWRVGSGSSIDLWKDVWVGNFKLQDVALNPIPPNLSDLKVSNIISPNQSWDITSLQHLLPNHLLNLIVAIPLPVAGPVDDGVYWQGSLNGEFSMKSAFLLIQQSRRNALSNSLHWSWIWKLECAERIKMFVWLLARGVVQTNFVRFTQHLASTPTCPRYEQAPETTLHLFKDCYYAKLAWEYSSNVPPNFFTLEVDSWLRCNAMMSMRMSSQQTSWSVFFLSLIWSLWKSRNSLIFEDKRVPHTVIVNQARSLALNTQTALTVNVFSSPKISRWVQWTPPVFPYVKLNTDGSMDLSNG
ncbi:hypothetical protein SLA2020_014850 [Shorea laevis]